VFGPDTLEIAMEKKERAQITARKKLNEKRVVEACAPFRLEYDSIKRREMSLMKMTETVDKHLSDLAAELRKFSFYPPNHVKKRDIAQLQDLYMLDKLQMGEEMMRIRDRLAEISIIIRNIYRQYEMQPEEIPRPRHGGKRSKRRDRFSQRQHCKYGRKNATKKR
jgi:hypothetical protein